MVISKIVLNNTTQIDLTDTTAVASDVASGKYFYGVDGVKTVGTNTNADEIEDSNTALGNDGTASLSEAITALTTYANETTGESDTTLSDAVETLVDGYGGGGGVSIDGIAMGTEPSGNVVLSTATNIKERKFKESPNIVSVTAPLVTVLREQIFQQCTNLESISFAGATTISSSMQFISCTKLQNVNLPNIEKLGGNMFQGCTNLEIIDLPKVTTLATPRVFYGCSKLQTVILRHTSLVAVNNDVFTNTPFAGYNSLTGTLYVPSSLVESYKTASNWSTLYNNGTMSIVAIEGSQYE